MDETKLEKEASLVCDSCGKTSQSKSLLYKHRLTHQKLDLPCKLCSKICTTKKNLREHIINVHGERHFDTTQKLWHYHYEQDPHHFDHVEDYISETGRGLGHVTDQTVEAPVITGLNI